MLKRLNELRLTIAELLNKVIIGPVNYWHIVHIFSGILIVLIFSKLGLFESLGGRVWFIIFGLLVIYEVFEKLAGPSFFKPETNIDVFLDIVLALGAGWLVFKFLLN